MIILESSMHMPRVRAADVTEFMLNPSDEQYQEWWEGTHLQMHPVRGCASVGQVIHMDEYVGPRRIKMNATVIEASPNTVTWRLSKLIRLPCSLSIRLDDDDTGSTITHTISAGFRGPGRVLDPLFRMYFTKGFERDMNDHFRTEFSKLADLLRPPQA